MPRTETAQERKVRLFTRKVIRQIRRFRESHTPTAPVITRMDAINQTTDDIWHLFGFIGRQKEGKPDWQQRILDEEREQTVVAMGRSCHCD